MDIKKIQKKLKVLGLRDRPSQLEMIEQVHKTIAQKAIICIEAPTGTGKTLSYLLASFYAKTKKQNVIISTATITLQEQLIKKDLPLLEQLLDEKIRYALAKGRRNYLCLAKLYQHEGQSDLFNCDNTIDYLKSQIEHNFWNGDREQLSKPISDPNWQSLTTDSAGCSGKRCELYDKCCFYKARNKMWAADFIVANHSLLLSDLELGSGVLLPEPQNNIYIIDECHHLPERSVSHFAKTSQLLSTTEWLNQINFMIQRAISQKLLVSTWKQKSTQCTLRLIENIKELRFQLDSNQTQFDDNVWRINPKDIENFEVVKHILEHSSELLTLCDEVYTTIEKEAELASKEKKEDIAKLQTQFKFTLSKITHFQATWALFCKKQGEKEPPIARWFEKTTSKSGIEDYLCHCSPINVSDQLVNLLWNKVENGALLCSATVRSLGSFNNFLRKTGLKSIEKVSTSVMPGIFNYPQSIIFIPTMKFEPSGANQQKHREEVFELLPALILPNSGTLVLFTSKTAMKETFDNLPPTLALDVLMQGQKSKMKLIESHKKRIKGGDRSILFGLTSFAEGIDLPAKLCQHVIIHKLPFAVPSSPIELTRSEWISQHQLNPFMLATLPDTSIKLTQYVGRLIRQEDDIGIVTILDKRLYTKNYGKQLLANLPPFTQFIRTNLNELKKHPSVSELFANVTV